MKKRISILLLLFCLVYTRPAYAVFDFIAAIEDGINLVIDIQNKVEQIQNKIAEIKKRITQGFALAGGCIQNPMQCDEKALKNFIGAGLGVVSKTLDGVYVMKQAKLMAKENLNEQCTSCLEDEVKDTYIYKRGEGDDMKRLSENRENINGIVINDTNVLFAKAITTRHAIIMEDASIYQTNFGDNSGASDPENPKNPENIQKILRAQTFVSIYTQSRLARILELRAHMVGAEATVELTKQGKDKGEE